MTSEEQRILDKVTGSVGRDQLDHSIVYVDWTPVPIGHQVQFGDALILAPWESIIAFVDLAPKANWGHDCLYLAVRQDGDDVLQIPAQMPPFLKAGDHNFRLLRRGPHAPEWAVATT